MIVVADLGNSNTDLLLAARDGSVKGSVVAPALEPQSSPAFLGHLAEALDVAADEITRMVVTGGRHRRLSDEVEGIPITHVDEIEAIGHGGLVTSGLSRALVVSMGTGTAFVSSERGRYQHAAGVALGGGTLRGLAHRLLGTTDPVAIAALAADGHPRGADYTVADLVGGEVGILPGDMPAAHLARLAQDTPPLALSDIAASVLDMIGFITTHMAMLTARMTGHDTLVMVGHMLEFEAVRRAAHRFERAMGGAVIVPPDPGFAVARGALALAVKGEAPGRT